MEQNETLVENKENLQTQKTEQVNAQAEAAAAPVETETQEQINWRKFREQREIERKQKEAAEKKAKEKEAEAQALKAAMEAILSKQPNPSVELDRPQYEEESEDDRIQKKIEAALAVAERKRLEEQEKRERETFPQRLAANFSDFNQVCTEENLDYLEYHYPEVAEAFKHAPDGYEKWASVYKAVKRFVPNVNSKKDQIKAEKNFNKPQSISVAGQTQTGDTAPHKLDDKRRADNWARMQRVMKGV